MILTTLLSTILFYVFQSFSPKFPFLIYPCKWLYSHTATYSHIKDIAESFVSSFILFSQMSTPYHCLLNYKSPFTLISFLLSRKYQWQFSYLSSGNNKGYLPSLLTYYTGGDKSYLGRQKRGSLCGFGSTHRRSSALLCVLLGSNPANHP
jgi:hypothetical protein